MSDIELTPTQIKVMRLMARNYARNRYPVFIGGDKWIHMGNSARSLVRKGLLESHYASQFYLTDKGKKWLEENPE